MSAKLAAIRPGSERSILFQAAMRVASNARRMRQRSREVTDEADFAEHLDTRPGPEDYAGQRRRRALLDEVLDALAIEIVASYAERFPCGSLKPEATARRIKALDRQGARASARQLAERVLVDYPNSPHARQSRALVARRDGAR